MIGNCFQKLNNHIYVYSTRKGDTQELKTTHQILSTFFYQERENEQVCGQNPVTFSFWIHSYHL